jgi:hypothetical protein
MQSPPPYDPYGLARLHTAVFGINGHNGLLRAQKHLSSRMDAIEKRFKRAMAWGVPTLIGSWLLTAKAQNIAYLVELVKALTELVKAV